MKRYVKLAGSMYKYCLLRVLEFRTEVISWSFYSTAWVFLNLLGVNLIFGQVNAIAGWNRNEVMALSIVCSMFNSFLWWFVYPSVLRFVETIRTGEFDFYLLKPVNNRFMVSFSRFEFDNYIRVGVTIGLLVWLISSQNMTVTPQSVLLFLILFLIGAFIFYCLFFFMATLCFWLVQMDDLEFLLDTMVTSGRYPTYIFKGGLKVIFFLVIPIAFVATFPVQALLGKGGWELVGLAGLVAIIFWIATEWFWNFAIKNYSSASS